MNYKTIIFLLSVLINASILPVAINIHNNSGKNIRVYYNDIQYLKKGGSQRVPQGPLDIPAKSSKLIFINKASGSGLSTELGDFRFSEITNNGQVTDGTFHIFGLGREEYTHNGVNKTDASKTILVPAIATWDIFIED